MPIPGFEVAGPTVPVIAADDWDTATSSYPLSTSTSRPFQGHRNRLTYRDRYDSSSLGPMIREVMSLVPVGGRVIADRGWTGRIRGQADRNVDAEARRPLVR